MKYKLAIISKMVKTIKYNRKIRVPDIKKYLVEEYHLTRELTSENKKLREQIEKLGIESQKLDLTLITLNEYKNRIEQNKEEIKELQDKLKKEKEENNLLRDEKNTLKIENNQIKKYQDKLENERLKLNKQIEKNITSNLKTILIDLIRNHKGNLSKAQVVTLIESLNSNNKQEDLHE